MQIETMKVFADLAETESFTKAARLNGVTQSAVSQQIGSLERHFGAPLIERSRKRFRLTREGEVLYRFSKQIVQEYEVLSGKIAEVKNLVSGSIRVSTIYSIGLHELPPFIRAFLKSHPTVNIQVEYRRVNQVYEDVLGNTVDLGLIAYPEPDPRLTVIPWRQDPMVLVCHPRHPFAAQPMIAVNALQGSKFIAFEPDIPTRRAIDKCLDGYGVEVERVMELDNIETVKRAVEIDAGISIIPRSTILQELEKKTLAEVKLDNGELFRPLAVIHRTKKVLTPAMKEFIALLRGEPARRPAKKNRTAVSATAA
jgi:LysR family transcriptional regulator, transcriptional activator of the cysJI operon